MIASKASGALCGLLFLALGSVFMGVGVYAAGLTVEANYTWARVPARIVSAEVTTRKTSKGLTLYQPVIRYEYRYEGVTRASNRMSPSMVGMGGSGSESWATAYVAQHPVGTPVTAFVKPSDPATAGLDVRISPLMILLMLFPIPHSLVGLMLVGGALLGTNRASRLKPAVVRFLYGWGVLALLFPIVNGTPDIWCFLQVAVYFAILILVRKRAMKTGASGTLVGH